MLFHASEAPRGREATGGEAHFCAPFARDRGSLLYAPGRGQKPILRNSGFLSTIRSDPGQSCRSAVSNSINAIQRRVDAVGRRIPASRNFDASGRSGNAQCTHLWTTFNVIQEHLVRGGDRYLAYTDGMGIRRNRTRPVASLTEGQRINKALWSLAGEFASN